MGVGPTVGRPGNARLDKTGPTGEYHFDFEYSREGLDGFRRSLTARLEVSNAATLQTAIEEKPGLKRKAN